jgi:uncharacterized protein (DUF1778 family)
MQEKTHQLQIRVTAAEKTAIQRAAARADMDMSSWVLSKVLPSQQPQFRELAQALAVDVGERRYALAELNDFLTTLDAGEFADAVREPPPAGLEPYLANYLAAMVETAANRTGVPPPSWAARIPPLADPVFGTPYQSVRLHLLVAAPPAFRRRNIFIDASIGDRV